MILARLRRLLLFLLLQGLVDLARAHLSRTTRTSKEKVIEHFLPPFLRK